MVNGTPYRFDLGYPYFLKPLKKMINSEPIAVHSYMIQGIEKVFRFV